MLLFRFHHGEYSTVDIDLVISSCTQKKSTLSASMTMNELLVRLYNVEVRVARRKRTSLAKSARFFPAVPLTFIPSSRLRTNSKNPHKQAFISSRDKRHHQTHTHAPLDYAGRTAPPTLPASLAYSAHDARCFVCSEASDTAGSGIGSGASDGGECRLCGVTGSLGDGWGLEDVATHCGSASSSESLKPRRGTL